MAMMLDVFKDVRQNGVPQKPRGHLTMEIRNYQFVVGYPFSSYHDRKLNLSYLKKEFMWYLSGDAYNDSILEASKKWNDFRQEEGYWLSNYGQYWFSDYIGKPSEGDPVSGIKWVVDTLRKDPDSRQAIIPMLQPRHLFHSNPDIVCTSYVNFHIRDNKLHMTVRMRSSDVIWGYGNDLPCFWWLHDMVALILNIEKGQYVHSSDSLHVYKRHFPMLENIVNAGEDSFYFITYPEIDDINDLLSGKLKSNFGRWLKGDR